MKKALIFCTMLVAMCSLAFADVDNISKANPAPARTSYVDVTTATLTDASEVKVAIQVLEHQMRENEARNVKSPEEWTARLADLYAQIGMTPGSNRGTLDQGGEDAASATVIPGVPYSDTGVKGAVDDCVGIPYSDVWYVYTVGLTGTTYVADMCNSDDDTYMKVWSAGTACAGAVSAWDDECGGLDPRTTAQSWTAGQVIYFECGNYSNPGTQNNYQFHLVGPTADRGRCCYVPVGGSPCNPVCVDGVFQTDCDALAGAFVPNGNCAANPCPTPLAGDLLCNALPYTLGSCVDGTTIGYTNDYDAVCPYTGSTSPDVVYSFTVAAAAAYTFSLCQGTTNYDTKLYLLASDGVTLVACNDDACTNGPTSYVSRIECVQLAAGDYYVVVDGYGGAAGLYTLCTSICAACPQECPIGGRPEGEPCPNIPDTYNTGCNDASGNFVFSQIACNDVVCGLYESGQGDPGLRDTDWYLLTVMDRESLTVSVVGEVASGLILVQGPCPGTTLASLGVAACSTATISRCLAPGDYYIIVVPNVTPAVCSRYTLTTHCEPCAPEPTCDFPNLDVEPNDDCLGAQAVQCAGMYCGDVNPSGDDDFYVVTLTACASLTIDVFANATPGYYPYGRGLDSYVNLLDATCTVIAFDDDGGVGYDSHLDSPCLPAGTYYIDVRGYGDASTGPYVLAVNCVACECPCVPTDVAFEAAQGVPQYACWTLCDGAVSKVYVFGGPADPFAEPIVSWVAGCDPLTSNCDVDCDAATYFIWTTPWTLIDGVWVRYAAGDGCVCLCFEGFLSAEMGGVSALASDGSVRLNWNTLSESGVEAFEIARAVKGHAAEVISSVAALGTPSNGHSYSYTDNTVANGTTYVYTLVVVNMDGTRETVETTVEATPSVNAALISEYALHQNFPNPFNPSTSIMFDMVDAGFVSLKVYNTLGQEVATVVNGSMDAGRHIVTFDANTLTSGMYLYRLEANGFSAQMKMLLMK